MQPGSANTCVCQQTCSNANSDFGTLNRKRVIENESIIDKHSQFKRLLITCIEHFWPGLGLLIYTCRSYTPVDHILSIHYMLLLSIIIRDEYFIIR